MVSKVAVIAIVGILAVPILLGFALNLDEVSETTYRLDSDSVNVTPLLENGIVYSKAHANIHSLNAGFLNNNPFGTHWIYNRFSTESSSLHLHQYSQSGVAPAGHDFADMSYDLLTIYGSSPSGYITMQVNTSGGSVSVVGVIAVHYSNDTQTLSYVYNDYNDHGIRKEGTVNDHAWVSYSTVGSFTGWWLESYLFLTDSLVDSGWVDFSAGFYANRTSATDPTSTWRFWVPNLTQSVLFTINLDSVTDANRTDHLGIVLDWGGYNIRLVKTTVDDTVKWEVRDSGGTLIQELYYDPTRTDNTYQILVDVEYIGESFEPEYDADQKNYNINFQFRYVGGWPSLIGAADYFIRYDYTGIAQHDAQYPVSYIDSVYFMSSGTSRSYTMRVDDALYSAFQYSVIDNKVYTPSDFKTNPSTKLTNIQQYGRSITFAGNTYPVGSDGNITLGTHQVSLKNIVFDSVPVAVGYENRINGNVISVSAEPSTIAFDGAWSATVTTTGQSSSIVSKTEWIPGQFAWDGIDDNFLIVGLITCLGVFIGLGIYARSHRMSIWPLLLVCGGAAALFIFMI